MRYSISVACITHGGGLNKKLKEAKHQLIIAGEELKRYNLTSKTAQFAKASGIYKGILSSNETKKLMNTSDLFLMLGVFVSDANFSPSLTEIPKNKTIHFLTELSK